MTSTEFRIEHDFLERDVPAHTYYGVQTLRCAENFLITEYRTHPALIRAIGMLKNGALANRDTGHLERRTADTRCARTSLAESSTIISLSSRSSAAPERPST
jgi:aspartate ammonia-lyase